MRNWEGDERRGVCQLMDRTAWRSLVIIANSKKNLQGQSFGAKILEPSHPPLSSHSTPSRFTNPVHFTFKIHPKPSHFSSPPQLSTYPSHHYLLPSCFNSLQIGLSASTLNPASVCSEHSSQISQKKKSQSAPMVLLLKASSGFLPHPE